jgi:NSS family neurotransmitter:Na+ symporter
MTMHISSLKEEWSSRLVFIFACASASLGIGNMWEFPATVGQYGGGDYVLTYLLCVIFIGIPLMMAEIVIGRRGKENPVDAIRHVALHDGLNKNWEWLGIFGILASFLILSYFNVVGAWSVDYLIHSIDGSLVQQSPQAINHWFDQLQQHSTKLLFYYSLLLAVTAVVIIRGLTKGIQKIMYVFFPLMILILIALVIYAITSPYFYSSLIYIFQPHFYHFSPHMILSAMADAFFSLSVGVGSIMMYGAYLPRKVSIGSTVLWICLIDTTISLLITIAIFPLAFLHNIDPSHGEGLVFKTIPAAFSALPFSQILSSLFFGMLVLGTIMANIGLLEPIVSFLIKRTSLNRLWSTILVSISLWLVGLLSLFSYTVWSNVTLFHKDFYELLDYFLSHFILAISGILLAIFTTHFLSRRENEQQLELSKITFAVWFNTLRYITPSIIFLVLLASFF